MQKYALNPGLEFSKKKLNFELFSNEKKSQVENWLRHVILILCQPCPPHKSLSDLNMNSDFLLIDFRPVMKRVQQTMAASYQLILIHVAPICMGPQEYDTFGIWNRKTLFEPTCANCTVGSYASLSVCPSVCLYN